MIATDINCLDCPNASENECKNSCTDYFYYQTKCYPNICQAQSQSLNSMALQPEIVYVQNKSKFDIKVNINGIEQLTTDCFQQQLINPIKLEHTFQSDLKLLTFSFNQSDLGSYCTRSDSANQLQYSCIFQYKLNRSGVLQMQYNLRITVTQDQQNQIQASILASGTDNNISSEVITPQTTISQKTNDSFTHNRDTKTPYQLGDKIYVQIKMEDQFEISLFNLVFISAEITGLDSAIKTTPSLEQSLPEGILNLAFPAQYTSNNLSLKITAQLVPKTGNTSRRALQEEINGKKYNDSVEQIVFSVVKSSNSSSEGDSEEDMTIVYIALSCSLFVLLASIAVAIVRYRKFKLKTKNMMNMSMVSYKQKMAQSEVNSEQPFHSVATPTNNKNQQKKDQMSLSLKGNQKPAIPVYEESLQCSQEMMGSSKIQNVNNKFLQIPGQQATSKLSQQIDQHETAASHKTSEIKSTSHLRSVSVSPKTDDSPQDDEHQNVEHIKLDIVGPIPVVVHEIQENIQEENDEDEDEEEVCNVD